MSGISLRKAALYGAAILLLLGLNLMRLGKEEEPASAAAVIQETEAVTVPQLALSIGENGVEIGRRDLFRPNAPEPPKPVVVAPKPAPAPAPPPPDPRAIAIERAEMRLEAVKLIGVLTSFEGALAVIQNEGNTLSKRQGEEIIPGFVLDRIAQDEIRVRNERLGLVAVLSLGDRLPMQMIRID